MRKTRIPTAYSIAVSVSRLAALAGTFFAVVGIHLIARILWVERAGLVGFALHLSFSVLDRVARISY
jgi:hypothetical protein